MNAVCPPNQPRRPTPGERVRLSWQREHTFAVSPQEGLSMEEEEA